MPSPRHFNVLILGGGFAGVYCAQRLSKRLKHHGKTVAIIASENHMVFQPMLAEVVGGSLSPRHVVNPIRLLCKGADVFRGTVKDIDLEKKSVVMDGGVHSPNITVTFDHLMLAMGADVNLSRTPGMSEHALLVRNVGDAMKLRASIIARMEEANLIEDVARRRALLDFVVVGGGYSGVEVAGQMMDMLNAVCKFYDFVRKEDISVTLIHSGDKVLPMLSVKLAEYTGRTLQHMGVKIMFNKRVKSVTACSVTLDDGSKVPATTVVCTVGNAPHPLILKLGASGALPVEKGHVMVEPTGRVKGKDNVWAAGDCSQFPIAGGGKSPETAQFAYRQGLLIADNIAGTLINNRPLCEFTFTGLGELASIGHRTAVAEIMGMRFSGFIAWFMWRSIYLMKLPGFDRKLRVMAEWTFDLFFPRDINLLTPQYSTPFDESHLEPGDPLFHHGEPAFSFYAVKEGRVDITDEGRIVKSATAGDHFGERALMEDHEWRYDATATEPTTLVSISDRTFQKLLVIDSFKKLLLRTAEIYDTSQEIEHVLAKLPSRCRSGVAKDLMMTNVTSVKESATLVDALALFQHERHSSYPVVNDNGGVSGLLRRADCYEWLKHHAMDPGIKVKEMPQKRPLFFRPDMPLPEVFETLIRTGASKGVVVDGDQKLLGLLTLYDLLSCPVEEKAEEGAPVPAM